MKSLKYIVSVILAATLSNAYQFCDTVGHTGENIVETSSNIGKIGGIDYELWFNNGSNSATFYSDGSMTCSFQNTMNYICRTGLSFDNTKTFNQIGHLYADYNYVENETSNVDYSYIGVYGWTMDPLIEYFIVENWIGENQPAPNTLGKNYGDFIINGEEYTIYEQERTGNSIVGEATYKRFYSIRKTPNSCGTVDITAHFEQWDNIGLTLGKMYETKVFAQVVSNGAGSTGSVDFPYALVYVKDDIESPENLENEIPMVDTTPTDPVTPDIINDIPTVYSSYVAGEESTASSSSNIINEVPTSSVIVTPVETNEPLPTVYDIKKENDINFILEAETVEPYEEYDIPDHIPESVKILKVESDAAPVLNEAYKNNAILQQEVADSDTVTGVVEVRHDDMDEIPAEEIEQEIDNDILPEAMEGEDGEDIVEPQPNVLNEQNSQEQGGIELNTQEQINNDNCVPLYAQCGGQNYNGSTCCQEGKCVMLNIWYYQCVEDI